MTHTAPVSDWATDFDVMDPQYLADPFSIWDELRQTCPIAHTDRRKSSWMPLRYEDVTAIAHDIEHFSSLKVAVIPGDEDEDPNAELRRAEPRVRPAADLGRPAAAHLDAPPAAAVVLAQPGGRLRAVDPRALRGLLDGFADQGHADAAADYAQQIPVRVIARILGVSTDLADTFTGWVRDVLEFADDPERRQARRGGPALLLRRAAGVPQGEPGRRPAERAAAHRGGRAAGGRRHRARAWRPSSSSPASTRPGAPSARRCGTWPRTPRTASAWWPSPS